MEPITIGEETNVQAATPLASADGERSEVSELEMVRQVLQEEYEIIKELGRGGMAMVFHAREKHLDRRPLCGFGAAS